MKVLQLSNKPPSNADGGALAIYAIAAGLAESGCEIQILCIETGKHPLTEKTIPYGNNKHIPVEAVFADTRVKLLPAFLNLFNQRSYNIDRFFSKAFEAALIRKLQAEKFDVIHLESLYMTPYLPVIRRFSDAVVVLRAHNVEHLLWQRQAKTATAFGKKKYFGFLAGRLEAYEKSAISRVDGIACITTDDEQLFHRFAPAVPTAYIAYGLKLPEKNNTTFQENTVFHIGAMDWQPNIDGVNWFIQNVWPLIRAKNETVTLHLAGRNMLPELLHLKTAGIHIHGEVKDAHDFMRNYQVMAVPLLSGGGMRIKIAEGMALGKAIVSTRTGTEGIPVTDQQQLLLADDAPAFANCILELLADNSKTVALGNEAAIFAGDYFDRSRITGKLLDFYSRLISEKK